VNCAVAIETKKIFFFIYFKFFSHFFLILFFLNKK
jgi:hypothetical protein